MLMSIKESSTFTSSLFFPPFIDFNAEFNKQTGGGGGGGIHDLGEIIFMLLFSFQT